MSFDYGGTDVRLLRDEKLQAFQQVKTFEFEPNEFEWSDVKKVEVVPMGGGSEYFGSLLTHIRSQFYIHFGGIYTTFSPGVKRRVDQDTCLDWTARSKALNGWLGSLRSELDTPDLWEIARQERPVLRIADLDEVENTPFTPSEKDDISAKLDILSNQMLVFLQQQQRLEKGQEELHQIVRRESDLVLGRIADLKQSASWWGRKDWLKLLFSQVLNMGLDLALGPNKTQALLHLAGTLFSPLVKLIRLIG